MTEQVVDPVTTEVIRNAFNAIAADASAVLERGALSPIIYEMHDFGVALFNERGEMLGQAPGHPGFIGGLDWGVRELVAKYGLEHIHEGDGFIINDSYRTGGHLSDVDVIVPITWYGEAVGFVSSRAHWLDIGTSNPGFPVNTTEIFQEGLQLGPTRIMTGGEWVRDILDILKVNSRTPQILLGDLEAQVAAGHMGERRFREVIHRFGLETIRTCSGEIFTATEAKFRTFISSIPDGVYEEEAFSDDDFVSGEPVRVKVKVTVSGDELTVDTTGSSRQMPSGINSGYPNTVSAVRLALVLLYPEASPEVNYGSFAALHVTAEPGSLFAAESPAPCMHPHPTMLLLDLVLKALAPAVPEYAVGGLPGDSWNVFITGQDPHDGHLFISGESLDGGWGAGAMHDGESAVIHSLGGDFRNIPVETLEAKYPILVRSLELGIDTGGAGTFRGGLNVVKEYEVLTDCRLTVHFDRSKTPQWGLFGGRSGACPIVTVQDAAGGGQPVSLLKAEQRELSRGSIAVAHTGGGGGYGDPLRRNPELVLADVLDGYVSAVAAAEAYGVVLGLDNAELDSEGTRQLRAELMRKDAGNGRSVVEKYI